MEKIKYYDEDGLVSELESDDYAVYALSKVLAVQLREKVSEKEAFISLALLIKEVEVDLDNNLLSKSDTYELVTYLMMKYKIHRMEDSCDEVDVHKKDSLDIKIDNEQLFIATAYVSAYGFIKHWNQPDEAK